MIHALPNVLQWDSIPTLYFKTAFLRPSVRGNTCGFPGTLPALHVQAAQPHLGPATGPYTPQDHLGEGEAQAQRCRLTMVLTTFSL